MTIRVRDLDATDTDRIVSGVRPEPNAEPTLPVEPADSDGHAPPVPATTPGRGRRLPTSLAWLPIPLLLVTICLL